MKNPFPTSTSGTVAGDGRQWSAFDQWLRKHLGYGLRERAHALGWPGLLPFEEAREFVRALGLKNQAEWFAWLRAGGAPGIPSNPRITYKDDWKGFGDWFGTGTIATFNRQYRPFEEAREFARQLGLRSSVAWEAWCKSGKKPEDVPHSPSTVYADQGWMGWPDWLGFEARVFLPFEEARAFARALMLQNIEQWYAWCKSGDRPGNIPTNPQAVYAGLGWKGIGDWLGTGRPGPDRKFLPFEEAREFVRALGLKNQAEWLAWSKSGSRPDNIPAGPYKIYKKSGWKGLGDWLGTAKMMRARRPSKFLPFEETRELARTLGLRSAKDWYKWAGTKQKPANIPAAPHLVYADTGWMGWGDFLGTGNTRGRHTPVDRSAPGVVVEA